MVNLTLSAIMNGDIQTYSNMYDVEMLFFNLRLKWYVSNIYKHDFQSNNKTIQLDSRDTTYLLSEEIIEMVEVSKRRGRLDLLIIGSAGYEFSIKHAIPINPLLPSVPELEPDRLRKSTGPVKTGISPVETFEKFLFVDPVFGHKN